MLLMLVCMVATAVVLQAMFETGDHTKSERIVRGYRGEGPAAQSAPSLDERLAGRAPGGVWSSEIANGCRGFVRVRYTTPTVEYLFDYDVPEHRIHPGNPLAEQLLGELPAAPSGGGAH